MLVMEQQWDHATLERVADADELHISSQRKDGSFSPPITIWSVRVGDDLFVRSVNGPETPWYRSVALRGRGHISAGGVDIDVDFDTPVTTGLDAIDAAYRKKYAHLSQYVPPCLTEKARATTTRIAPRTSA